MTKINKYKKSVSESLHTKRRRQKRQTLKAGIALSISQSHPGLLSLSAALAKFLPIAQTPLPLVSPSGTA